MEHVYGDPEGIEHLKAFQYIGYYNEVKLLTN